MLLMHVVLIKYRLCQRVVWSDGVVREDCPGWDFANWSSLAANQWCRKGQWVWQILIYAIFFSIYGLVRAPAPGHRVGSGVERIDLLRVLAGCCKRWLNQALSVMSLSLGFWVCFVLFLGFSRIAFYIALVCILLFLFVVVVVVLCLLAYYFAYFDATIKLVK